MGCEYSQKINRYVRRLIRKQYNKLTPKNQRLFDQLYGDIDKLQFKECYSIYYHCKRMIEKE